MENNVRFGILGEHDLSDVVRIHIKAFDGFFLTSLGTSFLRTYYKAVLKSSDSILIGAYTDQKLIGFGTGTVFSKGYNKRLIKKNFLAFLGAGSKLLICNPRAIFQLKKNFTKTGMKKDDGRYSELYSIAVDPDCTARGIGTMIIQCFEKEAKERGAARISLTTDFYENEKALAFYKKNGYELYYEFMAYPERKMVRLIKKIK